MFKGKKKTWLQLEKGSVFPLSLLLYPVKDKADDKFQSSTCDVNIILPSISHCFF